MGKFIPDGVIKVIAATFADPANPTLAEAQAGDDITPFLRELDTPLEGSTADASDASSKFNKTAAGTYGGQPLTASLYRDDTFANDTAWNALPRGTKTNILIARRGGSGAGGALAVGDRVDVWPIEVITRNPSPYRRNETTFFNLGAAVTAEPTEDVALA